MIVIHRICIFASKNYTYCPPIANQAQNCGDGEFDTLAVIIIE